VESQARKLAPEKRYEHRQRHAKPVLEDLRNWLDNALGQVSVRLDHSIEMAVEDEIFIDELNDGPDDRL